uniref:tRNA pseudouridine synthase n=1 Tax=Sinocyclocheilus grahami TaxID=75366 RepID=A0A672M0L4_SINGR
MQRSAARYLMFFQYAGTKYSGVMKTAADQAVEGVENHLEVSLCLTIQNNRCIFQKPTFTHAVQTEFDAVSATLSFFPPRITRAYRVHSDFHARYRAVSRTYVFRFASGLRHHTEMPVTERDLCWALRDTRLNIAAMQEAAALLLGTHDFSTFRALSSETPFKNPVKTLEKAQLESGVSFSQRHFHRDIQFWELTFKSRSFLYRQVRRMTGALVAVGQGRLSVSQIQELLETPDSLAFPQNLTAPAHGLFLTDVQYRDTDLGACMLAEQ